MGDLSYFIKTENYRVFLPNTIWLMPEEVNYEALLDERITNNVVSFNVIIFVDNFPYSTVA